MESNFLDTTFGGLKLNHYLVQYDFDPIIQFGLVSMCGYKVTPNLTFFDEIPICGT